MDARFSNEEDEGGVQIVFDVDPAATGIEDRASSPILASYLLSQNLEISIWAQNASCIFAVGVATLPLFVLLRQQRESVLFHGSLPIREPKGSTGKGRSSLPATDREDNLLHLRAVNVGSRGAPGAGDAAEADARKRGRVASLLPPRPVHRVEAPRVLGIAVPDHEVLSLARAGRFYDDEAALERGNLPFAVEYRALAPAVASHGGAALGEGNDISREGEAEESEEQSALEAQVRGIIAELALMLRTAQTTGLPFVFPAVKDLLQVPHLSAHMSVHVYIWLSRQRGRVEPVSHSTLFACAGRHNAIPDADPGSALGHFRSVSLPPLSLPSHIPFRMPPHRRPS